MQQLTLQTLQLLPTTIANSANRVDDYHFQPAQTGPVYGCHFPKLGSVCIQYQVGWGWRFPPSGRASIGKTYLPLGPYK